MIVLPKAIRIYLSTASTSMRKSFEGLSNEVRSKLLLDPLSGHVYLFLNRARSHVKILFWSRGGFTILHKRLEKGHFSFPSRVGPDATHIEIDVHELMMLLEGLDLSSARSARRWTPTNTQR